MLNRLTNLMQKGLLEKMKVKPVSRVFGFDRGAPIDRYYIEKFLQEKSSLIKGTTLEIAEREYSLKYGGNKIENAYVLHVTEARDDLSIKGNLETGEGIPENLVDCFILTQTLPFIYDIKSAANNVLKALRPGGSALITVSGISQISRYDMDRWGHYWGFTDLSLKKLFSEFVPQENIEIITYGNAKVASCFLYGLAQHELRKKDLDYVDPDYQLIITAVVKKPE